MNDSTLTKNADSGYGSNLSMDDYRVDGEIMVSITLHEYRALVEKNAKHAEEMRKKQEEAWKARSERDELQKKLDAVLSSIASSDEEEDDEQ